ncbi:DMT family transporter [Alicyclobacillus tolerans]|uniref:Uncharacterized membrane protein n=1 Tax=Alicyclobacillus tolerans TaxID=90970 RepID=A0A1M6V5R1_9BACL|nr:DMT family transporter [Alicyclobacillus montanus]SHK76780.1 Uncharacterized membrane protein [Alicyclobacillus montanus]
MSGVMFAVLSTLCYSLSYVVLRRGQSEAAITDAGLLPVLIVSTLLLDGFWLINYLTHQQMLLSVLHAPLSSFLYSLLSGILGTFLGRYFLYRAIAAVGATRGIIVKSLSPIFTMAIAFLWLREQPDIGQLVGIGLIGLSIGLLFHEQKIKPLRGITWSFFTSGMSLAFFAATFQGIGHSARKLAVLHNFPSLTAAAMDCTVATIVYFLVRLIYPPLQNHWSSYPWRQTGAYFATAGFLSAVGILFFFAASQNIPISTVAAISGAEPLLVTLFSILFLSQLESFSAYSVFAACLGTLGILTIAIGPHLFP